MEKILSALNAWFSGTNEKLSKLTLAQDRVTALEAELAKVTASRDSAQDKAVELAENSDKQAKDHAAELAAIQAKLTEAENKATEALANQGIRPTDLPAASLDNAGSKSVDQQIKSLRDKLSSSTDPKEKFTLSRQIRELLSKKN
jgi:hypothetical protein